jgi:enamine deaminase RidA (YjgF/YER057c/UK114 family)
MGAGNGFQGDIQAHTKRALDWLEEALKSAGSSMERVLKVTVFLADLKDYQGMNEAYQGRFGGEPPVRSTVGTTGIPDGTRLEVECVAYI